MLNEARLHRLWLTVGWIGVGLVIYFSLAQHAPTLDIEQGDKLQHLLAYSVLMLWFAQILLAAPRRWIAAGLLVGLGVALELAQEQTGWRTFSYSDMAANAAGVGVGWLLAPPRLPSLFGLARGVMLRLGIMQR
jgi:VanZ family protein